MHIVAVTFKILIVVFTLFIYLYLYKKLTSEEVMVFNNMLKSLHMNFDKGYYGIYFYEKDRRLTARQAWELIRGSEPAIKGEIGIELTLILIGN